MYDIVHIIILSLCYTDPMVDVMQTITEPTTGDDTTSNTASPIPSNGSGQDHEKTGHFKKRKPMKAISRTSINNLVDSKTEYDPEYDRQVNYMLCSICVRACNNQP